MAADFRVNGVMPDYATIELQIGPIGYTPLVKDVSYKEKLTRKKVFGTPRKAVGRTGGNLEPDGSITMYKSAFDVLVAKLGPGFGLVEFDTLITYRVKGTSNYVTDTLEACTIMEPDMSPSQGEDPLEVKVGLDIMRIKWNGVYMVDDDLG